jgi:hypothetical protein
MRKVVFGVCPHPDRLRACKPVEMLSAALEAGKLPCFCEIYGQPSPDGFGDCAEISIALLTDVFRLNGARGWLLCEGDVRPKGREYWHSWLEADGWVVDAASGKMLVMDARLYRDATRPVAVKRRTAREWLREVHSDWLPERGNE